MTEWERKRAEVLGRQHPQCRCTTVLTIPLGQGSIVMPSGEIMPGDVVSDIAADVAREAELCANYHVPAQ